MTVSADSMDAKQRGDDVLAACMFFLSLQFLAILAAILVLWIDVPRVVEAADETDAIQVLAEAEIAYEASAFQWGSFFFSLLLFLWPLFVVEQVYNFFRTKPNESFQQLHPYWWVFCVFPPLRLCAHTRENREQMWLPILNWQTVDRRLQRRLERIFSFPMILIALLILPVLGLQFYFKERIVDYPSLRFILHVGTGLIWFAFAVEFIVMVSVAEKKFDYCKKHWLDLAIILLPLISFLRTLQVLRMSKITKLGKLQQLTRVARVYRLRGVAMRGLRALMLLEVVHRLLRTKPESRIKKLQQQYADKQRELEELAEEIQRLQLAAEARLESQSPVEERKLLEPQSLDPSGLKSEQESIQRARKS